MSNGGYRARNRNEAQRKEQIADRRKSRSPPGNKHFGVSCLASFIHFILPCSCLASCAVTSFQISYHFLVGSKPPISHVRRTDTCWTAFFKSSPAPNENYYFLSDKEVAVARKLLIIQSSFAAAHPTIDYYAPPEMALLILAPTRRHGW